MRRKMHVGQIQGAVSLTGLSGIFSEMDVFKFPFFLRVTMRWITSWRKWTPSRNGFADKGYILLGWSEGGFIRLMSTAPISSIDDLRKAKVWIWEDAPMAKAIFDAARISAIPLPLARCPGGSSNRTGGCGICAAIRRNFSSMVHQDKIYDRCAAHVFDRCGRGKEKCVQKALPCRAANAFGAMPKIYGRVKTRNPQRESRSYQGHDKAWCHARQTVQGSDRRIQKSSRQCHGASDREKLLQKGKG